MSIIEDREKILNSKDPDKWREFYKTILRDPPSNKRFDEYWELFLAMKETKVTHLRIISGKED